MQHPAPALIRNCVSPHNIHLETNSSYSKRCQQKLDFLLRDYPGAVTPHPSNLGKVVFQTDPEDAGIISVVDSRKLLAKLASLEITKKLYLCSSSRLASFVSFFFGRGESRVSYLAQVETPKASSRKTFVLLTEQTI